MCGMTVESKFKSESFLPGGLFQGLPFHKTVYDLETSLALEGTQGRVPLFSQKASIGLLAVEEVETRAFPSSAGSSESLG